MNIFTLLQQLKSRLKRRKSHFRLPQVCASAEDKINRLRAPSRAVGEHSPQRVWGACKRAAAKGSYR
jgi:hypothetical protein